ncbi:hypothetical protein CRYUN_Cryun41cG0043100 [Craigia yunnanensis]
MNSLEWSNVQREKGPIIYFISCVGAPRALREMLNLKDVDEYKYLKQSNYYSITEVDDAEQFHIVKNAFQMAYFLWVVCAV